MHAAAEGRELDTADMIASLSTAFTLRYVKAHEIRISDTQSLRWNSTNGWNLYKTPSSGVEYLDRSFKTVKEARDYLMALRQTMSTHNRYAKKKLIR
jgi:hypothetical protein